MRTSGRPDAAEIRETLLTHGIDPQNAILAEYGPDQMCFIGVLVTPERRAWTFEVSYRLVGVRDFWGALTDVRLEAWAELTGDLEIWPGQPVATGLALIDIEASQPESWAIWWSWASEQVPRDRLGEAILYARRVTAEIRLGEHASMRALRAFLDMEGIPLDACVGVEEDWTDDARNIVGLLLVADGSVFRYSVANAPDDPRPIGPAEVRRWVTAWGRVDPDTLRPFEVNLAAGKAILSQTQTS